MTYESSPIVYICTPAFGSAGSTSIALLPSSIILTLTTSPVIKVMVCSSEPLKALTRAALLSVLSNDDLS
ncbi:MULTISPECIES: hypothetical protein [Bacillaceae]|uniref:hypothetical protein n=1 Tax=Bacillaceae TaxID=186817 RepID=UPI0020C7AEF3|nr:MULTISPECIES: hypothetical protein [Bacillaceae]